MPAETQKAWRGLGMEGWIAHWYTRTRRKDMAAFRRQARAVAASLCGGCDVLEVAPGPGFFAIELAKLGSMLTWKRVEETGSMRGLTRWTFRHVLLKRAYTKQEFRPMAAESDFGGCQISTGPIGFEVRFTKPARPAVAVS